MGVDLETSCEWTELLPGAMEPCLFDAEKLCKRDRLVSLMLQDRGALRLLSAPSGYGKTTLASEYAYRIFPEGRVVWVDGASPEFLGGLDRDAGLRGFGGVVPDLVIFEDVAFLDEERASSFRSLVEALLRSGSEVIALVLPSNDCLRNSQDDTVLITANDLMVTERDVRVSSVGLPERERASRIEKWNHSGEMLFGHAPCSVWHSGVENGDYLAAFFEERLSPGFLRTAFAMIMLGKGTFSDLEAMGIPACLDDISLMLRDYPFLGVGPLRNEFSVGEQNLDELVRALAQSGNGDQLLKEGNDVCQACVTLLLREGKAERAVELVEVFFNNEQRERWLERFGWRLLDHGEVSLLENLISCCGERTLEANPVLLALQSWACGLQSDAREALYFAKAAMRSVACKNTACADFVPYALAYLSFLAFCPNEPLEFQKPVEAPAPHSPVEHVAALVCSCTDAELVKGLGVMRGQHALKNAVVPEEVVEVNRDREELIESLIVSCERLCSGTTAFRLCLHLTLGLNSKPLRETAQEYGYGIMIGLRKKGVSSFTEAVLIGDLWRSGLFGTGARGDDIRDGRLLDAASALINRLSRMCGKGPCAIPWESGTAALGQDAKGGRGEEPKKEKSRKASRLPVAKVTIFGGMEVLIGDRYIPESYWNRRSLQLFTVLVLHQGRDVSRDTLFSLLWPGLSKTRARDNFYTAWSHMQALLGEGPYLVRRGEFCSVSSRYVSSDVAEFNQLARRLLTERDNSAVILDIYARMETLYRGGLLPGESGCKYIDQQREKYRSVYVDGMVAATHKSLEAKDARIALWFARRAMDEDAGREDVYYALIRAQIAAGQRCSAIRTYFQCRKFLSDELGLDPSVKTEALYEQLLQSDPTLAKLKPESFR